MKKSKKLRAYLIFAAVMVCIGLFAIIYIHNLLVRYEASQPERKVEEQIEKLEKAAFDNTLSEFLSFEGYESDKDAISAFGAKLKGDLRYEEVPDVSGGITYNIKNGSETLVRVTLESVETKTQLIVFNFETWEVKSMEAASIDKELELPSAIGIKLNGEALVGEKNAETGMMVYNIRSLTTPELILYDVAGNETVFDARKAVTTYGYSISVPSNYEVSANGKAVDPKVATSADIAEYEYVSEYCDIMPTQLTYDLYFLNNSVDFAIKDNLGNAVDFEMKNRSVKLEGQSSQGSVPESISSQIDVMEAAHQWSLFMTKDLTGANYGYAKINKYLIDDSYLQGVAWKWATGIDITFTSIHTLGNPPFVEESISDFVQFSEDCFSCKIKFKKHMNLSTGMTVMDPMDSTFYFVNVAEDGEDPIWLIADIRENVNREEAANG